MVAEVIEEGRNLTVGLQGVTAGERFRNGAVRNGGEITADDGDKR